MRKARAKVAGEGYYHIINRMSWQRMLLKGDWKKRLLEHIRKAAEFAGVEILTFAVMGNHFHLLARVEARREVSDEELVARMRAIYPDKQLDRKLAEWDRWDASEKSKWKAEDARARMRARMFDLSQFVKIFSERFTTEFNKAGGYTGSPWGQRFKSMLIERGSRTLTTVGAYIDLNPVRAKIAANPGEYQWTGLGAALRGDLSAREGLVSLIAYSYGIERRSWDKTLETYRSILDGEIELDATKTGACPQRKVFDEKKVGRKIMDGEMLSLFELLRCRVTGFCNGWALGSDGFARKLQSGGNGNRRRSQAYGIKCPQLAGIGTARRVRSSDAVALPKVMA